MAGFVKGEVVIIPFPFSDLSGSKRRPALVLTDLPGDDILLCQITSQSTGDRYAVPLHVSDFTSGSLPVASFIRPARIFTADKHIIIRKAGTISTPLMQQVIHTIIGIIQ